jgi:hypothetical protein
MLVFLWGYAVKIIEQGGKFTRSQIYGVMLSKKLTKQPNKVERSQDHNFSIFERLANLRLMVTFSKLLGRASDLELTI